MEEKNNHRNNAVRSLVKYSGIGIQIGITVYLGAKLGQYLDGRYPMEKKWFTMGCTILAVILSMYSVIQQLNRDNKE